MKARPTACESEHRAELFVKQLIAEFLGDADEANV